MSSIRARSWEMLPKAVERAQAKTRRPQSGYISSRRRSAQLQKAESVGLKKHNVGIPGVAIGVRDNSAESDDSLGNYDISNRKVSKSLERLIASPIKKPEPFEARPSTTPSNSTEPKTTSMYTEATTDSDGSASANVIVTDKPGFRSMIFEDPPVHKPPEKVVAPEAAELQEEAFVRRPSVTDKKKVIFDLDANTHKTLSSFAQSPQNLDDHSDFEIPSIEELPEDDTKDALMGSYESIVLSTKQSPKIAQISAKIQTQMRAISQRPTGGVETAFTVGSDHEKRLLDGSTTTVNSSVLEESNTKSVVPIPKPRKTAPTSSRDILDDLELSDFSF